MATATEQRPFPKTGAESEFERGVVSKPYRSKPVQHIKKDSKYAWALLIAAIVLGGGYYYYTTYYMPSAMAPGVTEAISPPVIVAPEATTPPVVAPDPTVVPKTP